MSQPFSSGHPSAPFAQPMVFPNTVENTIIRLNQMIYPKDTNPLGLARAGVILKLVDVAASLSAIKHCHRPVVTASLDTMNFVAPAYVWEVVTAHCRLTQAWNKSMEVEVLVAAENIRNGHFRHVGHGYFVLVAMDEFLRPTGVSQLILSSAEEQQRAQEAEARKIRRVEESHQARLAPSTYIVSTGQPVTVSRKMTEDDSNINKKVFGGSILELIHAAAEKAAKLYAKGPVIAVCQDRMNFEHPSSIGDTVKAMAVITSTWGTSMEIQVDVVAYPQGGGERQRIASCFMVFVAQDKQGHPKSIKVFHPKSPRQQQRWDAAQLRRQTRISNKVTRS